MQLFTREYKIYVLTLRASYVTDTEVMLADDEIQW